MVLPDIVAIGIYNSQKSVKNAQISRNRKTTMFEIELPMENGGVTYINSDSHPITLDMILCAKPGSIRHTKFPFKCYYIHMILREGELYDTLMEIPDILESEKHAVYREIFENLCKYYDTAMDSDQIMLQSLVLKLIYTLSKDAKKHIRQEKMKRNNYLIVEKVLKYIRENPTEDLSLEKMAGMTNLSPIHFHKCFKASVGKTLRDYVEEQRIKKAVNLLVATELSLVDIAFACGFSSQSYFSYVFKRRMQVTPREYAQQLQTQYEKIT